VDHRGCPLPKSKWLKKDSLLPFWKEWGGKLREDDQEFRRSSYGDSADKGKKRKSASELDSIHAPKKRLSSSQPASTPVPPIPSTSAHVDSISAVPMSISKIMFNRQLSELEYDECKSSHQVLSSSLSNCPLFEGDFFVFIIIIYLEPINKTLINNPFKSLSLL
jgi:hypothetical protein